MADTVLAVLGGVADVEREMILSEMGIWRSLFPELPEFVPDNPADEALLRAPASRRANKVAAEIGLSAEKGAFLGAAAR